MKQLYTTQTATEFVNNINSNFMESSSGSSSYTDAECRNRFIQEMNKKASLIGMTNTNFIEPAGNQPSDYNSPQLYPELFIVYGRNTMSVRDALRMLIYASGVQHICDAWNIRQFTLNYQNGKNNKTATINSTVFNNTAGSADIAALNNSYDILGGKTGSVFVKTNGNTTWGGALCLVLIVRSKATSKVYAVSYIRSGNTVVSGSETSSSNRFKDVKNSLDYVDNGMISGTEPSLLSNANIAVAEYQYVTPAMLNRVGDLKILYSNGNIDDGTIHPASVTKLMTAILLTDNVLDLNQKITIHESDRQPPTGTMFYSGDVLTLRDMLQCLVTQSSNTCAVAISRYVGKILLDRDNNIIP